MLLTHPHQMLGVTCGEVATFDERFAKMVDILKGIRHQTAFEGSNAIALAAPQIGLPLRFFTWHDNDVDHVMVNPVITNRSDAHQWAEEGCLSLLGPINPLTQHYTQGIDLQVRRHHSITVRYLTETGQPYEIECKGLLARIVQHEIDHLDGKLILDRVSPPVRKQALKRFSKLHDRKRLVGVA